jgi:hypothetical protein
MKILAVFVVLGVFVLADCVNDNVSSITGGNRLEIKDLVSDTEGYLNKEVTVVGLCGPRLDTSVWMAILKWEPLFPNTAYQTLTQKYTNEWGEQSVDIAIKKDPKDNHCVPTEGYGKKYEVTGTLKSVTYELCGCMKYANNSGLGTVFDYDTGKIISDPDNPYVPVGMEIQRLVTTCHTMKCNECGSSISGGGLNCNVPYFCDCVPGTIENVTLLYYIDLAGHPMKPL